jgi:hypothetical protein
VHDAVEIERRGVPAAAIITNIFTATGQAMAEIDGIPDYPIVIVPHPLSSLTEQELRARAAALVPGIVRVLLVGEGGEISI